ncbi:MAG: phosphoglycerate kinase [Patescibacteria group bacterium]
MRFLSKLKIREFTGKTCLLRVDFNVENVKDSLRLKNSLPTIKFLLRRGNKIVFLSHRGRPDKRDGALSLKFVIPFLEKNLKKTVIFLKEIPSKLPPGKIYLIENLRFWPGEEADDSIFSKKLARLGDFYVNDAFAVSHRKNASITQLPKLLPSYAGFLLEKEAQTLSKAMSHSAKPLVVIFGGAKVENKIEAIKNLSKKADKILLGSSVTSKISALESLSDAKILKPIDWIFENGKAFDIGPLTAQKYGEEIKKARTIIWNGPVGWFENKKFAGGSITIAKAIAASEAFSIIGGGETTQLILKLKLQNKIGFLSTGGGAMLEFLAGKKLPGIEALK